METEAASLRERPAEDDELQQAFAESLRGEDAAAARQRREEEELRQALELSRESSRAAPRVAQLAELDDDEEEALRCPIRNSYARFTVRGLPYARFTVQVRSTQR